MTIAERVQAIIDQEFGSNKKFSEKLEISPNTVTRWKNGSLISTEIILKLVELVPEVSADWILFGRGKMHLKEDSSGKVSEKTYGYTSKKQTEETKELMDIIKAQNKQISFLQDLVQRYQSSDLEGK